MVALIVLGATRSSGAFQRSVVERRQPAFTDVFRPGLLQRSPARVQHSLPDPMWSSPRWTIAGEHAPTKAGIAFLPSGQQRRGDTRIFALTRTAQLCNAFARNTRFCHDCAWAAQRNLLTESLLGELALSANAIFEIERAVSAVCPQVQFSSFVYVHDMTMLSKVVVALLTNHSLCRPCPQSSHTCLQRRRYFCSWRAFLLRSRHVHYLCCPSLLDILAV